MGFDLRDVAESLSSDCESGTIVPSCDITGISHSITGLTLTTTYSFRVCAVNANAVPLQSAGVSTTATTLDYGHLIFVSDTATDGDFDFGRDDLSGADEICQADAVAVSLNGTYLAILSRIGVNANSRFTITADVKNTNGAVVNTFGNNLFGGAINVAVQYGPTGADYSNQSIWTNSDQNGNAVGISCYDFNSNDPSDNSMTGNSGDLNESFLEDSDQSCDQSLRFYCLSTNPVAF